MGILKGILKFFDNITWYLTYHTEIVFAVVVIAGLFVLINMVRLNILNNAVRNNPTNENVKAYISFLKRAIIINRPNVWAKLRNTYYFVRDMENVDYALRLKLCDVLQRKGVNGIVPPKQNPGQQGHQLSEEKARQAGLDGEKQAAYALKWLDENRFKVFGSTRLSDGGEPQEFDSIVIGDRAIFNIEVKNYVGDLIIDENGNWYRVVNGSKTGMENPVFQVTRHNKVLNRILGGKLPIVDMIVWANVESVIEGAQYSHVQVVKVDQLTYFIENFDGGRPLSREERDFAANRIRECTQG
ncbi:MAG: NERD domain-containing protein [Clostridiales bacterium]|nr:NERD domain-containing protein [Clostridiales bacterium]